MDSKNNNNNKSYAVITYVYISVTFILIKLVTKFVGHEAKKRLKD